VTIGGLPARSLPELAFGLQCPGNVIPLTDCARTSLASVAQVYQVRGGSVEAEAASAAHAIRHAVDRLQRMAHAYGEWSEFDAAAYFDLTQGQAELFVQLIERVTTVHVTFYADLLLPRFQMALQAQAALISVLQFEDTQPFSTVGAPGAGARALMMWDEAAQVTRHARRLLSGDIGYLTVGSGHEEQWRWQREADAGNARPNGRPEILGSPSLSLVIDFPLPAWRQPGRVRRLMRHRALQARKQTRRR
jgi:hypothetical protein